MSTISTPPTPTPTLTASDYPPWLPDSAVLHGLPVGELRECSRAVLVAEARRLGPAERQLVVRDLQRVDPGVAGLELLNRAIRGRHAGGPDRRAEPERGIVGKPQPLVEVLDLSHRQRRPKNFLSPHPCAVGDVLEDRRLDEPSLLVAVAFRPASAEYESGPALDRVLDLRLHLGPLRLRVHRTHAAVLFETVSGLELGRPRDQLLHQSLVDAFVHVQALDRKTCLAAVEETTDRDRLGGRLDVRVVEHDARIAAAQLERDLLELLGRFGHHPLARRCRSGERNLADERVLHDRLASRLTQHDVDDALRQTAFDERLDPP